MLKVFHQTLGKPSKKKYLNEDKKIPKWWEGGNRKIYIFEIEFFTKLESRIDKVLIKSREST